MFASIKRDIKKPTNVKGASWLCNLEAYRRLFPPTCLATARVGWNDFLCLTLWGQFLNRLGRVKSNLVVQFQECLDRQKSLDDIEKCFPFQVFQLEQSIDEFYQFYGV